MEYFNTFEFFRYVIITAIAIAILAGSGLFVIHHFYKNKNAALTFTASLFSGILLFIFFTNILSYLVKPRTASWVIAIAFLIISGKIYFSYRDKLLPQNILPHLKQRNIQITILALLGLYIIFFINGLYDVYVFDEYFHRPVISSIAANNFPIRTPGNPFELSSHYNYHYGMDLLAAAFVIVGRLPNYLALDILSSISFVGAFFLFFGLVRSFSMITSKALATTILGLMSGGFTFLTTLNAERAAFFLNQYVPFLYSGYAPLFHLLYPITFIYIPLAIFFCVVIADTLINQQNNKCPWPLIIILSILFSAFALIGEVGVLIVIPTLFAFLAILFIRSAPERQKIRRAAINLILMLFLAGGISIIQGGTFTGMVFGSLLQQKNQAIAKNIASQLDIPAPTIIHGGANEKPLLYPRFVKYINRIFAHQNTKILFSELGLFVLFFMPLTVWGVRRFAGKRKDSSVQSEANNNLLILIVLMVISGIFLPTFFSSGRIADEYLSKFLFISISIFPLTFSYLLLSGKLQFTTPFKFILIILLILSAVPNFFLKTHFIWYGKNISATHRSYSPKNYANIDLRTLKKFQHESKKGIAALTSQKENWTLTDLAGFITYNDIFTAYPHLYDRVARNLRPSDLQLLNIKYIYLTPTLAQELTSEGRKNISTYFEVIAKERSGDDWRMMLKLKPLVPLLTSPSTSS